MIRTNGIYYICVRCYTVGTLDYKIRLKDWCSCSYALRSFHQTRLYVCVYVCTQKKRKIIGKKEKKNTFIKTSSFSFASFCGHKRTFPTSIWFGSSSLKRFGRKHKQCNTWFLILQKCRVYTKQKKKNPQARYIFEEIKSFILSY